MLTELLEQFESNLEQWNPLPGVEITRCFLRHEGAPETCTVPEDTLEALVCVDGQLELELSDGRVSTTSPSELLLLSEDFRLSGFRLPQGNATVYVAVLPVSLICQCFRQAGEAEYEQMIRLMLERLQLAGGAMTLHAPEWYASITVTMNQISESRRGTYFMVRLLERLWLGTDELYRETEAVRVSPAQADLVRRLRIYMQDHLEQRITIADLAEEFGMSPTYLKDSFRKVSGQPIHHYLQDCRLTRAARLLRTTEQSILSISLSVGYSGTSRFNAAFKDRYGMSPREYRQNTLK